ncbi:Gypsy retrotransposon integrase-like protein 1 [Marasmius tenuissimus]
MVNIPKTRRTYCKGKTCKKHTPHKVTQYKKGKDSLFAQGKRRYDRKQSGYGGQTKPVFHKKAKTTKKVVLRLECTVCKYKMQLSLKRCKHFELGGEKKTKGAALTFKRGPKQGLPSRKAFDAQALVNAILSTSKPFIIPEDPESVRQILVDLANYARTLGRQLSLTRGTFGGHDTSLTSAIDPPPSSSGTPEVKEETEVEDSIEQLTAELRQVVLTHEKRHIGKSSYYMLVQSAMDARRGPLGDFVRTKAMFDQRKRTEFWKPLPWQQTLRIKVPSFVFPDDDLLRDLVDLYFTRHNPFFPLLHRPTFERLITEGLHLHDRSFGATVLAVCAIASRQSNDPRALYEGTTSEHSLGWKYFRQIPLMRESFTEPPTLYDVQLCSLAVYFLQTASTPEAAWTIVGIGIRSAQEMSLHRKNFNSEKTGEEELWKRAFWILVAMDLFMGASMGRPRATNPSDFDCESPTECDDEHWENPDPSQAFVQPEGKPSVLSFFVTLLKLLDIVSFAQRTLYSAKKTDLWSGMGISGSDWKRKAVMEMDSALNKFVDEIPDHCTSHPPRMAAVTDVRAQ